MTLFIAIIASIMIAIPYPLFAVATGPYFGGRITSVSGVPPPCNMSIGYSVKGISGSICRGGGIVSRAQFCVPGGYILGFGAGTIVLAACGPPRGR